MNDIPTQSESPNGLHQRYQIKKIVRNPNPGHIGPSVYDRRRAEPPEFVLADTDDNAEYFVMRLDEGGKDREHIKACRIGVHAYADAIEKHLPELAKDLRERYPLL